jgi:SAM-dependent methyltransferase
MERLKRCYCGGAVAPLVRGPFYVRGQDGCRTDLDTILYHCAACDLVIRDLDYASDVVSSHFALASYTQPTRADDWRRTRRSLFAWLYGLTVRHLGRRPDSVLDFGCAYGHMLDMCAENGVKTTVGVEIAPQLVDALKRVGAHDIYTSLTDGRISDMFFDAVVAIDSLYLVEGDPQDLLTALGARLRIGGVIVIRTVNRNQVYRLCAAGWRACCRKRSEPAPLRYRVVGDAKFGFSERSLASRFPKASLEMLAAYRWERRSRSAVRATFDAGTWALHKLSRGHVDLCTGLVTVARRTG